MSLARVHNPLGNTIIRQLGDAGGPRSDWVADEIDNIITYANTRLTVVMFTGALKTISNTAAETTVFGTASSGSTLTIPASSVRLSQIYRVQVPVFFTTTGTPTGQLKIKLGSTTIADSTAIAFPTAALQSRGIITCDLVVEATGASGTARAEPLSLLYADTTGIASHAPLRYFSAGGVASGTINWTNSQALDVTWTWGTASPSNAMTPICSSVQILG